MAASRQNRTEAGALVIAALLFALASLTTQVVRADTVPFAFFSSSLSIATTYDSLEGRAGQTSTGTIFYDYSIPAVRFDARTTPDRAGDGTLFASPSHAHSLDTSSCCYFFNFISRRS
jgi:hypothetical protein